MAIVKNVDPHRRPIPLSGGRQLAPGEEASGVDVTQLNEAEWIAAGALVVTDGTNTPPAPAAVVVPFIGVSEWDTTHYFPAGVVVKRAGGSYVALVGNVNHDPVSSESWLQLNTEGGGEGVSLTPTPIKTAAYSAAPRDLVLVDISAGSVATQLPTAPADKTQVALKILAISGAPGSTNATLKCGGTAHFNTTAGSTTLTLSALRQGVIVQYKASNEVWYVISTDTPLGAALGAAMTGADNTVGGPGGSPLWAGVQIGKNVPLGTVSGTITPDMSAGNVFILTTTGTGPIKIKKPTNWPSTTGATVPGEYHIRIGAESPEKIEIEGIEFPDKDPEIDLEPNALNIIQFISSDAGITLIGGTWAEGPPGPPGPATEGPEGRPHFVGDGSDGAVVLDGTIEYPFATRTGATYVLTRDVLGTTVLIESGVIVKSAGFRIFGTVSIVNKGKIVFAGLAGSATGTGGGKQGAVLENGAGGEGTTAAGAAGSASGMGTGKSGAGGLGTGGAGGAAGAVFATATAHYRAGPAGVITGQQWYEGVARRVGGGPGGGGGGGDGTNKGGGGGAGGGMIALLAPKVTNEGALEVPGGNGGTPTTGVCGGGGAGGGGAILIFTTSAWTNTGTTNVAAGTPGTNVGGAGSKPGSAGTEGLVLNVVI